MEATASTTRAYRYEPLDPEANEFRLLELLPGHRSTPLTIIISKIRLVRPPPRSYRQKLQESLPADWRVRECLDGRYLFERVREYGPEEAMQTTWHHPITGLDPNARRQDSHSAFKPEYEALSYVWAPSGNEDSAQVLSAGDRSDLGSLAIRRNLSQALRYLRHSEESRMVWIDALCINQEDLAERSDQVAKMGRIYGMARNVMVWLGMAGQNSHLAFKALRQLGMQLLLTDGGAWTTSVPGCNNPEWSRPAVALPFDAVTWQSIADLVRRPWFERLWVWQEVTSADDRSFVQCGDDLLPLHYFQRSIFGISCRKHLPSAEIRGLILDTVELMLPYKNQPFFRQLQALSWKACADPRDKIYGVLGAAPKSITDHIIPRYDVEAETTYKTFCLVLLTQTRRLDFLDRCDLSDRQLGGPTWVPDFSVAVNRYVRLPFADLFYAGGVSMSRPCPSPDHDSELVVVGRSCGIVESVGDKAPADSDGLLSTVKSWEPKDLYSGTYITGESLLDAYVTLLGLGYFLERWPQTTSLLRKQEACALYRDTLSDLKLAGRHEISEVVNFIRARNRYFVRTSTGFMGMTFTEPEAGDVVAVLLGSPSPILLRSVPSGKFKVVGPAYVHGLMDTEHLLGPLPSPWHARMGSDYGFFHFMHFYNPDTGEATTDDPRLPEDPPDWERLPVVRTSDDPWNLARYRHRESGLVINADPRMSEEALRGRGVELQEFTLV